LVQVIESDMLCIKCMKLLVKYIFLTDVLFLDGHLRFGKIPFLLADMFYLGGHLRLELSCILVNTVSLKYFMMHHCFHIYVSHTTVIMQVTGLKHQKC